MNSHVKKSSLLDDAFSWPIGHYVGGCRLLKWTYEKLCVSSPDEAFRTHIILYSDCGPRRMPVKLRINGASVRH